MSLFELEHPSARASFRQHAFHIAVLGSLLFILNPEVRLLVLFVDALGIDLLLLYAAFSIRTLPLWCRVVAHDLWRGVCSWGPVPFHVPGARMWKEHPLWSSAAAAAAVPGVAVLLALSMITANVGCALVQML